jgi:predicted nuclease of predicted toxin-antitoxin system
MPPRSGLSSASDEEILARGRRERWIVVTLDADFHALLALSAGAAPSVIRIRRQGLTAEPLAQLILDVLSACRSELEAGALVTVRPDAVKVHRLPVMREGGD